MEYVDLVLHGIQLWLCRVECLCACVTGFTERKLSLKPSDSKSLISPVGSWHVPGLPGFLVPA